MAVIKLAADLATLENVSYDLYAGIVTPREHDIVTYKSGSPDFSELGYMAEVGGTPSSTWEAGYWKNHKTPGLKYISITLDRLISESSYPVEHFEIDCEGMEVDIFENYSWICKPDYISVAPHGSHVVDHLISLICGQGYNLLDSSHDLKFKKI